jgi:flagellar protein FliS
MVTADAYQKYREQEVNMANPVALIVMLYNGCIKQLKLAQIAIDKKNYEDVNDRLKKAQNIVSELAGSLDFNYSISKELLALYDFMLREIIRINVSKDGEKINPLIRMLSGLRDSWVQVEKTCRPSYDES